MEIGTLIRMREWSERIRQERERDEYYSDKKHEILVHYRGPDYLRDWPTLTDSIQ